MEFGLISGVFTYPGLDQAEAIELLRWEAQFAERAGFATLWVLERHFGPARSSGAPSVILAHLAALTRRLGLGFGVALLNLHHPLRFAEEVVWLDHLSGGRVRLGLSASASPEEAAVFGVDPATRWERFTQQLALLRQALAGEPVAWPSPVGEPLQITLVPPPLRPGTLPLWLAASTVEAAETAAHLGLALLVGNRPPEVVAQQLAAFRAVRAQMGAPAEETEHLLRATVANRRVYLGRTVAAARQHRERAEQAMARLQPPPARAQAAPRSTQIVFAPPYCGEPGPLVEELRAYQQLGVGQVILGIGAGGYGLPREVRQEMLTLAAEAVLPAFEASPPGDRR
jgi:alkanesulfonate monooxygenase SsuD/methylene tetrahydromethanopterin reductase-like flavin-dependent oxidoreductase (luciferase family)